MKKENIEDRRKNKWTRPNLVIMKDTFLSGWGKAEGGISYAAWACKDEHLEQVLEWVKGRSDSKAVRVVSKDYVPQYAAHYSIYEVTDGHPSLHQND